jgi:hypothetical protein
MAEEKCWGVAALILACQRGIGHPAKQRGPQSLAAHAALFLDIWINAGFTALHAVVSVQVYGHTHQVILTAKVLHFCVSLLVFYLLLYMKSCEVYELLFMCGHAMKIVNASAN